MTNNQKEILEFVEYIGFKKNDDVIVNGQTKMHFPFSINTPFRFEYEYKKNLDISPFGILFDCEYIIILIFTRYTAKLYNRWYYRTKSDKYKGYIGSFTNVDDLIEYLNDTPFYPIDLIDNIRIYKLNKIINCN